MRSLGLLLVVVACHVDPPITPDAPIKPDGPALPVGMFVSWSARPALPGPVTDKITVTSAHFRLEHLQLLSDVGADDRTTRSRYEIAWDASGGPGEEKFPDAPAANYQRILVDLRAPGSSPYSYDISGTWRDGGQDRPFRVVDRLNVEARINCAVALAPGDSVSIGLRVDLRDALNTVDWKQVQEVDGVLTLNGGPQLIDLHHELEDSFKLDD